MHSTENQKNLVTISEKKMLKLDDEIKKKRFEPDLSYSLLLLMRLLKRKLLKLNQKSKKLEKSIQSF